MTLLKSAFGRTCKILSSPQKTLSECDNLKSAQKSSPCYQPNGITLNAALRVLSLIDDYEYKELVINTLCYLPMRYNAHAATQTRLFCQSVLALLGSHNDRTKARTKPLVFRRIQLLSNAFAENLDDRLELMNIRQACFFEQEVRHAWLQCLQNVAGKTWPCCNQGKK